mmetsp:Transcript_26024/g.54041  ORF Transcript_26024/g.54041 Transcript_26024/m.54041 type:complete len:80 (+) Transcript_26024:81-320(+)
MRACERSAGEEAERSGDGPERRSAQGAASRRRDELFVCVMIDGGLRHESCDRIWQRLLSGCCLAQWPEAEARVLCMREN